MKHSQWVTSVDFQHTELMALYCNICGFRTTFVRPAGNIFVTGDRQAPHAVLCDNFEHFVARCKILILDGRMIPVCIGEPGPMREVIASLRGNGVWLAHDFPNRDKVIDAFNRFRFALAALK